MNICSLMMRAILLVVLGAGALMDVRDSSLPVWFLGCSALPGIVLQAVIRETAFYKILLGCAAGLLLLGVSLLSRQAIGIGDSVMFIVSGIYLGFELNVLLLLFSLAISAAASVFLIIRLKTDRRSRIPFMPFMLGGYICLLPMML